ncbi:MAG: GH3 auxin-responsive promoter family protein [Phycisphaerae bacterium]|nr:GH3 auxin-responsive promoter family protein [Phycisphaerae bacterium]
MGTMARRWTRLVGLGLRAYLSRRIARLGDADHWRAHTARIQLAQLRGLLRSAGGTEFGRAHGFARLATLPDADLLAAYRKALPPADWYAFKDRIARMREGAEPDVLWPGLVRDFAQTSGTTAGDKFIPVSREMMRSNFRASLDIFCHLHRFGASLPGLTAGRSLFLGGSTDFATSDTGIRTGDLSGLVVPMIRWPVSEIYLPGREIALMSHWPSKLEAMARACVDRDVRMISGVPSWTLSLFEKVVALAREGGRDARTVADVWPNLTAFVHGGVRYAPFEPRMREAWSGSPTGPDIPIRHELYPASEGFVAMQDTRGDPGLRLMSDVGNFYEFVPLERVNDADAPAHACWEVEKGRRYVVCMSTCSGLYRYILGDVVEFDTIPAGPDARGGGGPCRLRIVGRHKHFINAFGENLIVEHVENAVARAARETGWVVGEFTAAPVYPDPGAGRRAGLELAIEVRGEVRSHAFARAFDAALKAQNVDYTTKRTDDLGMAPPTVTVLPMGTFERWMASRGKLGGQHKCPRCANHRDLIDGVVEAGWGSGVGSHG